MFIWPCLGGLHPITHFTSQMGLSTSLNYEVLVFFITVCISELLI